MKIFILVFSLLLIVSSFSFANADSYRIDDNAIELLFAQAEEISIFDTDLNVFTSEAILMFKPKQLKSDNSPITALVLCAVIPSVTGLHGFHRLYLGTDTVVFIAYLITCGGCGILTCVDSVLLLIGLIDDDISKYIDNPALIMW